MKQTPLEHKLSQIARPVVEDLGFALVMVKTVGEAGGLTVQIMAENPETHNIGVDDCAKISRALSATFDVEDPISGHYRLEVSSPGIDRPLTRLEDFQTYQGYEVKIESDTAAENGQKKFRGRVMGLEGETILLSTEQGDARVAFSSLLKAKLVLTDELIKKTANL
jgi:ribosome maturation factor RimP